MSFDVDALPQLDEPEVWEISFVRNIAQSGFSIAQINKLLTDLPRPYRYDPANTTYHFVHGWVTPLHPAPFDVIDREVDAWIDHLAEQHDGSRLRRLAEQIEEHLDSLGADSQEEE